ncbi:disease resistance protein RPP13-like [Salvia miltiorrhiza]|uniref:disease resistance protein RPP13-like n=1 Tax=Salvia miltiorrhiza TaxID=226208 RepID=UPI0025ABFC70|nr:disease resistance protein RPP13-like [Salvia miltiorrhiza]XP_057803161.1 disease resistance protein RPP13-like [Salvia miltiorrhiza]
MMLGSHEDLFWVMKQLTFGCSSSRLQVLSIVGTGGIGKTTFAETIYNSPIMECFDIRGWVTVSQDYSEGRVALDLLASVKGISTLQSKIPKEDEIREYLMGGRYLIVMDNVWSKKAWDDVRKLFPDNDRYHIIIILDLA